MIASLLIGQTRETFSGLSVSFNVRFTLVGCKIIFGRRKCQDAACGARLSSFAGPTTGSVALNPSMSSSGSKIHERDSLCGKRVGRSCGINYRHDGNFTSTDPLAIDHPNGDDGGEEEKCFLNNGKGHI